MSENEKLKALIKETAEKVFPRERGLVVFGVVGNLDYPCKVLADKILEEFDLDKDHCLDLLKFVECSTALKVLERLYKVLVNDGEQFVAGEIRNIAKEYGAEVV